ncbi:Hsp20/alpha crystallin family protein [Paenibacillus sp. sgz500958]|uniref:Hsp20/alpha crystallin family protein n=1 Tax=Paenibacillus sp. sgz500958 TaxID=3242475 RepID=UPI0036D33C48
MRSNKSNPMNWLNEDPFFKQQLSLKGLEEQWKLDPNQIDGYVENIIREATSSALSAGGTKLRYEHLDTHNYLITKIVIPEKIHPENIWVQLNRTQIRINGLGEDNSEIIPLPYPVNPDRSKGTFKQRSLQLRMLKLQAGRYKDIEVRFL